MTSKTTAQSLNSDFFVKSEACLGENISLENNSTGSVSYLWDFCGNDFNGSGTGSNVLSIPESDFIGSVLIQYDSGEWFGFASSQLNNILFRLSFGNDLSNTPSYESFLTSVDGLSGPKDLELIKVSGVWYGLLINSNDNTLLRITFDNRLDGNASVDNLGTFTGINRPISLDIKQKGDSLIAAIANLNGNDATLVNFKNGILSSAMDIESMEIGGSVGFTAPTSLTYYNDVGNWYGILTSRGSSMAYLLEFGSEPFSEPSFTGIQTFTAPEGSEIISTGDSIYGFVVTQNFGIYKIGLGSSGSSLSSGVVEQLGSFGVLSNSRRVNFVKDGLSTRLFCGTGFGDGLVSVLFENNCTDVSETTSVEVSPTIQYSNSGKKGITLISYDSYLNRSISVGAIEISIDAAPAITFTKDNSVCISNANSFFPSDPSFTSYNWDFNGDGIVDVTDVTGADQAFDYSGLGAGTYTVRLDVSDGACNNFYEDEITIYDSPPSPSYTYTASQSCINADHTFTNTTSDGAYGGPLAYLWEFINEPSGTVVATADTKNAVYAFETAGEKTVRLTSSIPGCEEIAEQTLMITPGPTADFFAASVCQGEAMQFTNASADSDSYSWDFGDGYMSAAVNPSHIFSGAGNFSVTLTATDSEGCEDSTIIEVAVSDSPQISFDFDIPCTSSEGIQFFDLTTVDNADLVAWTWFVDDVEVSTEQSPQITFSSSGVKNIRLDVQSSNGCESSYSEDIEVLTSPTPDFGVDLGCHGEVSSFTDITTSATNPVVSWLWTVDGTNYTTKEISHTFTEAGIFEVTLEITGQNFCSESITKNVEIIELPSVDFSVDGECDNQLIRALDQSSNSVDPVIARRWKLDGANVGNGTQLILDNLEENTYDLALELETLAGCIISSSQTLEINNAPESSFTSSRTYGVPSDQLSFTNNSNGGIAYQWLLDGELRSTDPEAESITFSTPGTYTVSLVAQNSLGCYDTTDQQIRIAIPEVDLAIGDFELIRENTTGRIFLEVQNFSNLPVEITEAQVVLENRFTVTEQILKFIDVGESTLVSLNVGIPLTVSEPSYFCVKLASQYVGYEDIQPINNEKCITIEPVITIEDPYPNPVSDQFRLKLIAPEGSIANLSLVNSAGKIQIEESFDVIAGLNNLFIETGELNPGIYHVIVSVQGTTHKRKVIKL